MRLQMLPIIIGRHLKLSKGLADRNMVRDIAKTAPAPAGLRHLPADALAAASGSCASASESFSAAPSMLCISGLPG
jgi:hypothetical protein